MNATLLEDHIDPFLRKCQHLKANNQPSTLIVFAITDELKNTLENKAYNKALLNDLNGKQSLLGEFSFTPLSLNKQTLSIFLTLNDFLLSLESVPFKEHNPHTQSLLKLLIAYRKQSLLVGLNNYKGSCLVISDQKQAKKYLTSLLNAIKHTLQNDVEQYRKEKLAQAINETDKEFNISQLLGKSFTDQTKATILEHSSLLANDAFSFIDELESLLKKPKLSYKDIYALKNISLAFQNLALSLPSVKEVTQYHWLINFFVNLINKFIVLVDSDKTKKVKQICMHWQSQWIDVAKSEVETIEQQIYLR